MSDPRQEFQEHFRVWKTNPVTQALFDYLKRDIERLRDGWASGSFDATFTAEFIARNSAAKGACSAYKELLDLESDTLYEVIAEEE